jgi:uncharacterized protein (TIGR03118 family)
MMWLTRARFPARRRGARTTACPWPAYRPWLEQLEGRALPSTGAGFYQQTNLVSDQAGVARILDPNLVNAWGISLNQAGGAFWVANNVTGTSTLYTGDVNGSAFLRNALVVTIPDGSPTGTVFNGSGDFVVSAGAASAPARFLFASQVGEITGWNPAVPPATTAKLGKAIPDAVYTGLAIGSVGTANFLYAANFANRSIDVFDKTFQLTHLDGTFTDPDLPPSYAPFNIQNLGGKLYVAYAQRSHKDPGEETGHGSGFVDVFDTSGHLLQRIVSGNHLHAPWGLALAPSDFGTFSNALLVGNFGTGHIAAFNATTGKFLGELSGADGKPIVIDGLWGIIFGNGVSAGDRNALYFAAGPEDETHGLFGSLRFAAGGAAGQAAPAALAAALLLPGAHPDATPAQNAALLLSPSQGPSQSLTPSGASSDAQDTMLGSASSANTPAAPAALDAALALDLWQKF